MLKKENRITLNKDFDRAFKLGNSFFCQIFSLKVVDNTFSKVRLGMLVGSKVSKKAVTRNEIKRIFRDKIAQELEQIVPGKDLVFVVFPQIIDKNKQEIVESIESALKRAKLKIRE